MGETLSLKGEGLVDKMCKNFIAKTERFLYDKQKFKSLDLILY